MSIHKLNIIHANIKPDLITATQAYLTFRKKYYTGKLTILQQ